MREHRACMALEDHGHPRPGESIHHATIVKHLSINAHKRIKRSYVPVHVSLLFNIDHHNSFISTGQSVQVTTNLLLAASAICNDDQRGRCGQLRRSIVSSGPTRVKNRKQKTKKCATAQPSTMGWYINYIARVYYIEVPTLDPSSFIVCKVA